MRFVGASRAVSALLLTCVFGCGALGLAACGSGAATGPDQATPPPVQAASGSTEYPVDVSNCGRTLHFDQAPQRIVSGWTTSAELLIELGLADRIVGQYNTSSGTPVAKYAAIEKTIPARNLMVGAVADGIMLSRWMGETVEEVRLRAGDLRAQALATLGEKAPPPPTPGSDHSGDSGHNHGS